MKKFLIAWLVLAVVWMASGFLVHQVLLGDEYLALQALFRPETEAQSYFGLMVLANVMMAGAFVWIYSRGISAAPWFGQGFRFGIAVALLTVVPVHLIYYVVQPMPQALVIKQILFDGIRIILMGIVVAGVYRQKASVA